MKKTLRLCRFFIVLFVILTTQIFALDRDAILHYNNGCEQHKFGNYESAIREYSIALSLMNKKSKDRNEQMLISMTKSNLIYSIDCYRQKRDY